MKIEGDWTYYTAQEAEDILVLKRADDEFDLDMDGRWDAFDTDARHDQFKFYAYENKHTSLPSDVYCIRRRNRPEPMEAQHFI